nr:isoform 3 of transcription factor sp1 [Quercus suber]
MWWGLLIPPGGGPSNSSRCNDPISSQCLFAAVLLHTVMSSGPCLPFTDPYVWPSSGFGEDETCHATVLERSELYQNDIPSSLSLGSITDFSLFQDELHSNSLEFAGTSPRSADTVGLVNNSSSISKDIYQSTPLLGSDAIRPGPRGPYLCICERCFDTLEALDRHSRSSLHRVYVCPNHDCRKSFYRRDSFARHKSQHNAGENFLCSRCPKAFKRKDHLDQHIKNIHSAPCIRRMQRELGHGTEKSPENSIRDWRITK